MADKKNPGCLTRLVAFFLLAGLCIWGIKSCGEHAFTPETPERAEKRKQQKAAKAEKRKQEEAVKADKWKQEEAKQPQREELIEKLLAGGVFRKVEFQEFSATVWVDSTFYLLDFEAKQKFCSVVYAYLSTHAKDELVSVALKDALSGKTVGDYGQQWTGFGLKMK